MVSFTMKVVQNLAKCDDIAPIKLTFHGVFGDPVTKSLSIVAEIWQNSA